MSTSPVSASWAIAGTRPPALSKSNIDLPFVRSKLVGVARSVLRKRLADVGVVKEDETPDRGNEGEQPENIWDDRGEHTDLRPVVFAPFSQRGHASEYENVFQDGEAKYNADHEERHRPVA